MSGGVEEWRRGVPLTLYKYLLYGTAHPTLEKIKLACSTHRVYHHIELDQGFPKPV
eukprot:SAG11_NODE_15781_length_566_cov_2.289079_1_plen_55_part_10